MALSARRNVYLVMVSMYGCCNERVYGRDEMKDMDDGRIGNRVEYVENGWWWSKGRLEEDEGRRGGC